MTHGLTQGRDRNRSALVILALLGAAALVVWLARTDEGGRAPAASGPGGVRPGRTTPVVDLAPPSTSTRTHDDAPQVQPRADSVNASSELDADESSPFMQEEAVFDGTISIRGVRGLVRDATTHEPVPGAWLTWRYPDPTSCEQVLGAGAQRGDARTGMVTDAHGRFTVDRLPDRDLVVASTLFAVATGYAVASTRPGLREDVVIDLEPMGTLEVVLRGVPPEATWVPTTVTVEPTSGDPARKVSLTGGPPSEDAQVYRAPHLARGEYRVRALGHDAGVVLVEPGRTARVEVALPVQVVVEGTISGFEGRGQLRLVHPDGGRYEAGLDFGWSNDRELRLSVQDGRVSGIAHVGRYVGVLSDAHGTERRLPDLVDVREGRPLSLRAPDPGAPVEVRVRQNGVVLQGGGISLVPLDLPTDPCGRDLVSLGDGVGNAGPGRYAVFAHALLAGEVVLPAGPTFVDTTPFDVVVRWGLPGTLREDEVLRGRLRVIPEVLARDEILRRRYDDAAADPVRCGRASPTDTIRLLTSGRYLLLGETDLGPFEAWVDLAPGVEVFVPLGD